MRYLRSNSLPELDWWMWCLFWVRTLSEQKLTFSKETNRNFPNPFRKFPRLLSSPFHHDFFAVPISRLKVPPRFPTLIHGKFPGAIIRPFLIFPGSEVYRVDGSISSC